jgi:hypothetical protein
MAQVVKCLPNVCKVPGLFPSSTNTKKAVDRINEGL